MRFIFSWIGSVLLLSSLAQSSSASERILVSMNKTVSLVFPVHILSIDRGSDQVLVQKSAAHILKVKAVRDSFPESNLTVITVDGKLYSFILVFATDPSKLIWYFGDTVNVKTVHPLQGKCDEVRKMKSSIPGISYSAGKTSLQWMGWFIHDNTLFCKLQFINRSAIGYDIDQFQCYIRDNTISRRTATQELIQQPLFVSGDTGSIKAKSSRIWIIALEKFTIPDDKHFAVEVLEKNGGRHLYLRTSNRLLMTAQTF